MCSPLLHTGFEVDLNESSSSVSCLHTLINADLVEEEVRGKAFLDILGMANITSLKRLSFHGVTLE